MPKQVHTSWFRGSRRPRIGGLMLIGGLAALWLAPALAQKPPPPFKVDADVLKKPVTPLELQAKMAEETSDPIVRQTRIDRLYFIYRKGAERPELELRFEG